MSVRIRLARIGKKKAPVYRIVAIDSRAKRDGKFLENLGTYNPVSGEMVQFHAEKIQVWIEKGAQLSDTVVKLQRRFKKGQTAALTRVVPVKKQTPSKAELEAKAAAEKPVEKVEAPAPKKEAAPKTDATAEPAKEEAKKEEGKPKV
jgi:small subunit ribosomal protein S16